MKNKKILLLFSSVLLLNACQNGTASSESQSGYSSDVADYENSSGTEDSSLANEEKIRDVISKINEASEANSLTVEYVEKDSNDNEVSLKDIYTPEYAFFGYSQEGYLLLDSYNKKLGDKLVYNFSYDEKGNVQVGNAVTYYDNNDNLVGVNSVSDMNFLTLLKKGNTSLNEGQGLQEDDFECDGEEVYVLDEDVLAYMCRFMGYQYGDSETRIADVSFFLDGDTLNFNFYYQPDSDSSATSLLLTGKIVSLNNTKDEKLAKFVADYELPSKTLSDTVKNLLSKDVVGFDSVLKYYSSNKWNEYGKVSVTSSIDKDNRKNDIISYDVEDEVNDEKYSYVLSKGALDLSIGGLSAIDHYVDGKNQEKTADFQKGNFSWGNGIFSFQDEMDVESFLGDDGNNFLYYGLNADRLLESYSALTVLTDIIIRECFKITLNIVNNSLVINSYVNGYVASPEGDETELKLLVTSTLKEEASISMPSSFTEETEDSKKVSSAIDHLKEESWTANGYAISPSTGLASQHLPTTNYYYKKDEYYIQDWANRTRGSLNGTIYNRQGYKQVEGGIIPFSITKASNTSGVANPGDAVTTATEIDTTHHLYDYFGFDFDAKVFEKGEEENTYVLKDGVKNIAPYTMGSVRVDSLVDKSYKLTLDAKGRLSKINYNYVYGGIYSGKEEIKFTYEDEKKVEFPSAVVNEDSFNKLSTELPSTWLGEQGNVAKIMVKLYGEEVAKQIPYLAKTGISKKWELTPNYDGSNDQMLYNTTKDDEFVKDYKALLLQNGYEIKTVENATLGKLEYYTKTYQVTEEVTDGTSDSQKANYAIEVRIRFASSDSQSTTLDIYFGSTKTKIENA